MATVAEIKKRLKANGINGDVGIASQSYLSNSKTEDEEEEEKEKSEYVGSNRLQQIKDKLKNEGFSLDNSYIESFINDANSFFDTVEKDYSGLGWGNASSVYNSRQSTWNDLDSRSRAISAWLEHNKDSLDSDAYKSLYDTIENIKSGATSTLDAFRQAKDYYAQWDTEDAYKAYEAQQKEYDRVKGSDDFSEKSQYSSTKSDSFWDRLLDREYDDTYEYINNQNNFRSEYNREYTTKSRDNMFAEAESNYAERGYDFLKPEEIAIYNYYYSTEGKDKAQEFLDSLTNELVQRKALKEFDSLEGNTLKEIFYGVVTGADQFRSGIESLGDFIVGGDGSTSSTQYVSGMIREDLADNGGKIFGSSLGQIGYDLVNTTANMLPSILVGTVTGGLGGAVTLGASAVGNGYSEMKSLGYDDWQARGYGILVGASETALQYLLGGIGKLGGKLSGNAVAKLVSKFDNAIARIAIKYGGNIASEGLEESIQTILEPAFKALVTGEDFEAPEWNEVLYSGLLGALSAGVLEGTSTFVGEPAANIKAKNEYGDGSTLVKEALEFGVKDSEARTLGEKYQKRLESGKELTGTQIRILDEAIAKNDTDLIKKSVLRRLGELGETTDVTPVAEVLTKYALGEKLSSKDEAVLDASNKGRIVMAELNKDNIASGGLANKWAENIGTRRTNPESYNKGLYDLAKEYATAREEAKKTAVANSITEKEQGLESKFEASEGGETIYKGETVTIKDVASVEGGEIKLRLDNGEVVSAKDVSFATSDEALVYSAVADMDVGVETANEIINAFKATKGVSAKSFVVGATLAYQYGTINYEAGLERLPIPQNVKKIAYNRGRIDSTIKSKGKAAKTFKKNAKKNGIIYENGFTYDESTASEIQKVSMQYADVITKISNLEVHVFESKVENGKRVTYINGKLVSAPNGYYKDGNKIYLDFNAGNNGEGAMLYTLSHEISHYIREHNAKGFKAIGDFLMEQYGKKGVSVEALIKAQKDKIRKRYKEEGRTLPNDAKLFDMAYEELVADAMSDMLADPKAYEKLAKLKQKDRGLWEQIGEAIKAVLDKLKGALGIYKNVAVAEEAYKVRDFGQDAFNKLQDLYLKAFLEADANYEAYDGGTDLDGNESSHLFSDRSMVEGAGLQFVIGENGVDYKVLDRDGNPVKSVTAEMIVDSPLGNLVTMAKHEGYLGKGKEADLAAKKQYGFLADLVNMCINYNGLAPIWETAGTMVFSSMKSNADKQYGLTVDFSTVCKKTQAIVDAMSEAMLRLGRGLTRAEVEAIYLEVGKAGESTPCPVCYVFSRWMGIGGILDQISRFQDKYVAMSEKSLQAFIADIKQRVVERANTPGKNGKLKSSFFNKKGEISEGQVIADLKAKASSKAASALNAIAKNSSTQLEIQELEALMENQDPKEAKETAKKIAKLKKKLVDVSALEKAMREANDIIEEYEAYQWLTRTLMVESNGKWIKNSKFKPVPKDILFDLNKGDQFAEGYPLSWAFRTGKGASAGKAIVPYADARVGEAIQSVANQSPKDIKIGLELNPFLNSDTEGRIKILKSAIAKQARQNLLGGQRYQSTSDFRYEYGSDYLITFLEMQAIGAKVQLYTKVIEAVDFLASMGADCNLSVMPLSDGFITLPDGTKKLVYSSVTGINAEAAIKKSHEYNNVQLILVGISDEHIRLALEGLDVTFVIPFHGSGNSVHQIQALMNMLGENLDVTKAQDYTFVQSDHVSPNQTKEQKAMWDLRVKIVQGKASTITASEQALLDKNPFLKDLYRRFYIDESAEEFGVGLTSDQSGQIFPYEYWDKSLTYAEADKNGDRFKEYCASMGIIPRFSGKDSEGKSVGYGDFSNDKGYWKLLIDRPMYDNTYDSDGNWTGYGKYHEQARINCSNFQVNHLDPEYGSATYGDVMSKANDPKKTNKIVDAALKQFENNEVHDVRSESKLSDRDSEGGILSAEQQKFFKDSKVRDPEGNLTPVYHGTPSGGFTEFKLPFYLKTLTSAQGAGFYFTDKANARQYMRGLNGKSVSKKQLYKVYLNITNPLEISEHSKGAISDEVFRKIMARGNYEWGMSHTDIDEILRYATLDSDRLAEMVRVFNGEEILTVMKEELGYDGVRFTDKYGDIWVAWDKSQIKNTTNKAPTSDTDIRYSDRDYSYESLVSKPDMKLTTVGGNAPSNRADVVAEAKKNAAKVGKFNPKDGSVSVHVDDIDTDVIVTKRSLVHGLDRRTPTQAPVLVRVGEILKNSIKINELTPRAGEVKNTYVLIGAAQGQDGNLYVASFVVNKYSNEVAEIDVLYSVNAKKESAALLPKFTDNSATPTDSTISIAQLLDFVNSNFPDILPESVLRHFGYDARPEGKLGESALYSDRGSYAPTFYSHMSKVIDDIKLEKMGASSILNHLKNRGVKDEEIKWSGVEAWLEGKKSVTKAELQEFVEGSQLRIEEETLDSKEPPYTAEQQEEMEHYTQKKYSVYDRLAKLWEETYHEKLHINRDAAGMGDLVQAALKEKLFEARDNTPEGIAYREAREALKEIIAKNDDFGFDNAREAYVHAVRNPYAFALAEEMSSEDKAFFKRFEKIQEDFRGVDLGSLEEGDLQLIQIYADQVQFFEKKILDVKSEHYSEAAKKRSKWIDYRLKGGENYRELLFKMPNSDYSNSAMYTHWEDRGGVLAHARIQDMTTSDGKRMLFVEEIQSDWHNEGHKKGYDDGKLLEQIKALEKKKHEIFLKLEDYSVAATGLAGEWDVIKKTPRGAKLLSEYRQIEAELKELDVASLRAVPDAPFRDTYHEYALKRLIRMAAEEGYDSIGWTPSEVQMERWNPKRRTNAQMGVNDAKNPDEVAFEKGYQIEYDQDIPKFLRKYGKKWGATVGTAEVNGTEVWSMDITDSMKDSVLDEGQPLYSERVTDKETLDFLNGQIERGEYITVYRSFQVRDGGLYAPMNAVDRDEDGKNKRLGYRSEIGQWEMATESRSIAQKYMDEHPDAPYAKFNLDAVDNKTDGVAYNPYLHATNLVLNDQFAAAYRRNLVTVECRVPLSEAAGDYKADFAKDSTGWAKWKAGGVAGQLKKIKPELERKLFLSRYMLPVKILTDAEVARMYKDYLDGTDISVPWNVVTPSLRRELEKVGVNISYNDVKQGSGVLKFTEQFPEEASKALYSDRDTNAVSDRTLLANALESVAQNDVERRKLAQYKSKIALIEAEQAKLSDLKARIKALYSAPGARDTEAINKLQFEANQAANRINTYDRQLLALEATSALKGVLEREKSMAYKKAQQKGKEALSEYKAKVAKTQRELMTRYQESRKNAVDSRHRTEMRHKIKSVVTELDKLLRKGTKDRNVKLGLQSAVASALEAINMDTVDAEGRIAKLKEELVKAKTPEKIQEISRKIDNIQAQGDRMASRLEALRREYANIKASEDNIPDHYRQEATIIANMADDVMEKVGNTPLRNMSMAQLEAVYKLYTVVLTTVRNANAVFKKGRIEDLQRNASDVMMELESILKLPEERSRLGDTVKNFSWHEMIPVYAFERIGSKTLTSFFWEAVRGQNTYAVDVNEANEFASATRKKYGYSKWDMNKVHEFTLPDGRIFRLTLKHMMSIVAYSKREQALSHMRIGGFFFNDKATFRKKGGVLEIVKSNEAGYCVDDDIFAEIVKTMNTVAKGSVEYVAEMQDYLTKMGEKGNEVSRVLWGIDIFKEKVYFPLKSSKDFIYQANQPAQEASLKNDGMTKETKPGASNPIVLEAFDDVWATHVNRMSQYHAFVLPIENLNKILNYGSWAGTDSVAVSTMLRERFTSGVIDYLTNFIQDLNGASSTHGASNPFFAFVSKFKKTAVAASLSVVVQQPTAILRALAVMDGKYFVGKPDMAKLSTKWEELKKYAPIAIIKEIGGFDAGAGRQTSEWINADTKQGVDKVMGKIDDVSMMGAALFDQLGWTTIWEAVKREVKATTNLSGEALLQKAGERFTEVIVKTQVYDSTLSRSGYMRSKHDSVKMLTAFMGEPTVSFNMLFHAISQAKTKKVTKKQAARMIGAVYASVVMASAASSLIYALRDDDDDESYLEKLAEAFGGKLISDINPLNMLPAVRDIMSILDGWDVSRTDMDIFQDLYDAVTSLDSENKSAWRKVEDLSGAFAHLFGVPLKNTLRTGRELFNLVKNSIDGINPSGVGDAFLRGVTGEDKNKGKALYEAIINGDEARLEVYRKGYKDDKAYETAVRTALRENDPRIKEAAVARNNGDTASYMRIAKAIIAEGNFSQDTIVAAINAEINALKPEEEKPETNKEESIFKIDDYYASIVGRDQATAYAVKEDLIRTEMANGKDREEAEATFNSKFVSHLREQYEDGNLTSYTAKSMLVNYAGKTEEEAESKVKYWDFKKEYPDYDLTESAVEKYYEYAEPSGISVSVYYNYSTKRANCKGTDLNGDGKTDSGSVKSEVLKVIDSLPLTSRQKDALYYLNGWSESTLYEAPWH